MTNAPTEPRIEPRHALVGAAVHDIDLARPLDDATVRWLEDAWTRHLVLVFPDQPISDAAHIAFARHFGALEIHPSLAHRARRHPEIYRVSNVDEDDHLIPPTDTGWQYLNQSWRWHSDSSFRPVPSKGSILHGIETTRDGGNTRFANLYAAYEALPAATRTRIDRMWVIHDHDHIVQHAPGLANKIDQGSYDPMPKVRHPLVRRHPVSGRRALFLSPHTTAAIEGLDASASSDLLDELAAHATRDTFVYCHEWRDHDVLMWDNRCTIHAVEPFDNTRVRRIMHRVTLVGEEAPIPAADGT